MERSVKGVVPRRKEGEAERQGFYGGGWKGRGERERVGDKERVELVFYEFCFNKLPMRF